MTSTTQDGPHALDLPVGSHAVCAMSLDDTGMQRSIGLQYTGRTFRRQWVFRGTPEAWLTLASALESRAGFSREWQEARPGRIREQAERIRAAIRDAGFSA